MGEQTVYVTRRNGIVTLTLANPPMNLITVGLTRELDQHLEALSADNTVRVLIVTGEGENAFCAGSDIREFAAFMEGNEDVWESKLVPENEMYRKLAEYPAPTIAAIDGIALGGGLELAICCDLVVADQNARLGLPEVKLGVFPGSGGTFRLARRIGDGRAKELMFLGETIDAERALSWGLVNRVASTGTAIAKANELADHIAANSPKGLRLCKQALASASLPGDEESVKLLLPFIAQAFREKDIQEGVRAFFAKETPRFSKGK